MIERFVLSLSHGCRKAYIRDVTDDKNNNFMKDVFSTVHKEMGTL